MTESPETGTEADVRYLQCSLCHDHVLPGHFRMAPGTRYRTGWKRICAPCLAEVRGAPLKVLAEAWGIEDSDGKLVEVRDIDGPLLFYKECELAEEIGLRMADDEHVVRVKIVKTET